ncbi:MAG: hypothetical protein HQL81_15940 [Magnetococcales bacterium]|nr:hypothetical protein [Magnetococcales bacterium]
MTTDAPFQGGGMIHRLRHFISMESTGLLDGTPMGAGRDFKHGMKLEIHGGKINFRRTTL